jgi:calcium-dependent protein kinase
MGNCECFQGLTETSSDPRNVKTSAQPVRKSLAFLPSNKGKHPEEMYDIEKKGAPLGSGAFGTVKLGRNRKTGQTVALKSIAKKGRGKVDMAVLQNEIDINTAMDHPNVARMYETFEDNQFIYIAMELCSGGEMFDLIIDEGSFSEAHAAILMEQILRAVFYMHHNGVVHRDLKPENFLLTKKAKQASIDQNTLKVIDFGIAKRFDNSKGEGPSTLRTKAGTAYYIAPEVLAGKYNEKCDVWSCGVILYILLCGAPPFAGDSDQEILEAVKRGRISFNGVREFDKVTQDVKQLILQLCTLDRAKRINAETAVGHKWITTRQTLSASRNSQGADSAQLIAKFKAFSSTGRFKKAALHIIAHHVDEDNLRKLREQFNRMDKNGDGELTLQELQAGCKELGIMKQEDVNQLFQTIDSDNNGSISYSEFLAATIDQKTYMKRENYWEAFRVFDLDGNGKVTLDEFKQIMKDDGAAQFSGTLGANMKEIEAMFKEADKDGDGEMTFEEFVQMMEKS